MLLLSQRGPHLILFWPESLLCQVEAGKAMGELKMTWEGSQASPGAGVRRGTPVVIGWAAGGRERGFCPSSSPSCWPGPGSFPCSGAAGQFITLSPRHNCQRAGPLFF